jgi:hypothetical protein
MEKVHRQVDVHQAVQMLLAQRQASNAEDDQHDAHDPGECSDDPVSPLLRPVQVVCIAAPTRAEPREIHCDPVGHLRHALYAWRSTVPLPAHTPSVSMPNMRRT